MIRKISGGYRFRLEGKLLVLQVEEIKLGGQFYDNNECVWRDATIEDFAASALIDAERQ